MTVVVICPPRSCSARDTGVPAGWTILGMSRGMLGRTKQWRADYGRRVLDVFKDFRIRSREWNGLPTDAFDVSFTWRRIQAGLPLDNQLFVDRLCSFPRDAVRGVIVASVRVRGSSNGRPVSGRVWAGADYKDRSLRVGRRPRRSSS